jgi:predicted molibdopterin-dependent oxidoreductase YjgC
MTRRTPKLNSEVPGGFVQINPADAANGRIKSGDVVTLRSRRGSIDVLAKVTTDVPPRMVFVPFHFAEACANVLTNPALDPACKMPEYKVCAVRVEVQQ